MFKEYLYKNDGIFFIGSITIFYFLYGYALDYGRTYDDFQLVRQFFNSPGDAKLISTFFYAKFHFYPIYFLSHELDNFLTYTYSFFFNDILNVKIAKNTNFLIHIFNSYLVFVILKILFAPKNLKQKFILYLSSLLFLFHPINSQIIFNITTRNESLALFFALLTFIYSFKLYEKKNILNLSFVILLYFFALCSKLMAVTFLGIIPFTIFLIKFKTTNFFENLKKIYPIFFTLLITFIIFYIIRNSFIEDNSLKFYSSFETLYSRFLIALKFYLRGLFFPFEHIYIYADNYQKDFSLVISFLFFIFLILSIYIFLKQGDPFLIIIISWISASLSIPILFNLIEYGFPLISKLAERYQYSSTPALSILAAWLIIKSTDKRYFNIFISSIFAMTLIFLTLITFDRSKVYKDNLTFFSKAHENSPTNAFEYFFSMPMIEAIKNKDKTQYLFNLYQLYSLYPLKEDWIFQFMNHFATLNNKKAHDYFLDRLKTLTKYHPPIKFKLAEYYFNNKEFKRSEEVIGEIFVDFDKLILDYKKKGAKINITKPELDDVYFLLALAQQNQNKTEEALGNFMMATLHNPMHATALYNSSILLKELGQHDLAKKHFQDAIELNPFLRETIININSDL